MEAKFLKKSMNNWIPRGMGLGANQNTGHGRGMDILRNNNHVVKFDQSPLQSHLGLPACVLLYL